MEQTPLPTLRQASTVILVRETNRQIETFLLKRSNLSGFMDGLYVFPGGVVDREDRGLDEWAPFLDLEPEELDSRLGGPGFFGEDVLGHGIAAIRETLEEAGVLMARTRDRPGSDLDRLCRLRLSRDLPKSWFKEQIMAENWILSLSGLARWSHWITPQQMKKRFDTRFFTAFMPDGQTCVPDHTETRHGLWITPEKALEQNLEQTVPLSPPTVVTLTELLAFKTSEDLRQALSRKSWGHPLAPCLVPSPAGPVILEPWDPCWHSEGPVDSSGLPDKILPPGSCFSRIWCDKGIWKPVAL